MSITFKNTKDLDFEKVIDIFFSVYFLRFPEKRELYKTSIQKAFQNSQYVVSAYEDNELIGFVRVLTDESIFATIRNMIVDPKYQKIGIGKQLIRKCLSHYPNLHFFLFADDDVTGFYEKIGFKIHKYGMFLEYGRKVCIIYN
jgi:ribosomal protein S18 acetylase RimI-like enzyme